MSKNLLHGRAIIKINGKIVKSMPGATIDVGGYARTTQTGDNGVHGFTREYKPAKIECQCAFGAQDRIADFDFDEATIEFICDSGQTYVVTDGWTTETPQLGKEGIKLTIEGPPAEEML